MDFKVIKAQQQYIYEVSGIEFIDCTSNEVHVGHSHPQVVSAAQRQMNLLMAGHGFYLAHLQSYIKQLLSSFNDQMKFCFLVNSRSEANDLAIRLARNYTQKSAFVVFEKSDHGHFRELRKISPKAYTEYPDEKGDVFTLPVPHIQGRKNHETITDQGEEYTKAALDYLEALGKEGKQIAGFISETVLVSHGVVFPPNTYYKRIYEKVKSLGGVTIAEESNCGLGRLGECIWGFKLFDVAPDIITIGPALGNGFPLSAVITTKDISGALHQYNSTYGGNPVSCAVGKTVLEIIDKEKLAASGTAVGRTLLFGLEAMKQEYPYLWDIRGMGLCIGIELRRGTTEEESVFLAQQVLDRMKLKHHFIVECAPCCPCVIVIKPPMCFNQQNARSLLAALKESIGKFQGENSNPNHIEMNESMQPRKKRKIFYENID